MVNLFGTAKIGQEKLWYLKILYENIMFVKIYIMILILRIQSSVAVTYKLRI